MGKPLGWMDTSHALGVAEPATSNSAPPWPLKKSTAERIQALTPAQQRQVDDALDVMLRGFEAGAAEKKSTP